MGPSRYRQAVRLVGLVLAFLLVICLKTATSNSSTGSPPVAWSRTYDNSVYDVPGDITVDRSNNIYITGTVGPFLHLSWSDWLTVKYDENGNVLWAKIENFNKFDRANGIAADSSGNVYVTGYSGGSCVTVKYNENGGRAWARTYDNNDSDKGYGVAVGPSGYVYVVGSSVSYDNDHLLIIKYDEGGNEIWARSYDFGLDNVISDADIAFDSSGNAYVAGSSLLRELMAYRFINKYDGNGGEIWSRVYEVRSDASPVDIAVDSNSNVYFTTTASDLFTNYVTMKHDSNGNLLWQRTYGYSVEQDASASAAGIAVDSRDNVYVTGTGGYHAGNNWFSDYLTVKYDPDGNLVWGEVYAESGTGASALDAAGIAAGLNDDLYVTGGANFNGNWSYHTIKYKFSYPPPSVLTSTGLSPSSFTLYSGQSTTLTATLTADNVPLVGKTVSWSAALGVVSPGSGTTDNSGRVSVTYIAPVTGSELWDNITATFAGDNQYLGSSGYSTGHILIENVLENVSTQLVISPPSFTLSSAESRTLTATLTADNAPLVGKAVSWSAARGVVSPGSGTTGSSGQFSITYAAPFTDQDIWDNITAVFAGDNQYRGSSGYSTGHITPRLQTQLVISPASFTLLSGQSTMLTATLTAENAPLAGKVIIWSAGLGGVSSGSGTTDNAGQVLVSYTAPITDNRVWDNILARFNGDNRYKGSSGSSAGQITVLDTDNDGMPDSWENRYGLSPGNPEDASQDDDGDGYTNVQEYWVGTNPLLASSYPGAGEEQIEVRTAPTEGIYVLIAGALISIGLIAAVVFSGTLHSQGKALSVLVDNGITDMRIMEINVFVKIRDMRKFTVPQLTRETNISRVLVWRTVQKLIKMGLVRPTAQPELGSNGVGGRGKPSIVYEYVGK